jgi:hypothetical protein
VRFFTLRKKKKKERKKERPWREKDFQTFLTSTAKRRISKATAAASAQVSNFALIGQYWELNCLTTYELAVT